MQQSDRFVTSLMWIGSGVLIWAVHFLLAYGTTSIVCARQLGAVRWLGVGIVPWAVGIATALGVGAAAWIALLSLRRSGLPDGMRPGDMLVSDAGRLAPWLTVTIAVLAIIAMLWDALPVMFIPVCG